MIVRTKSADETRRLGLDLAARLAPMLGARRIADASAAADDEALVMVASNVADVRAVAEAERRGTPPAVVVAWHLPESALVRLLELGVPCLIGEPDAERLQAVVAGGDSGISSHAERAAAARYAVLENWLAQPPQAAPAITAEQ